MLAMMKHIKRFALQGALGLALCAGAPARAVEWHGLLDLRAIAVDADRSWTNEGLGKLRYDRHSRGVDLGQAFLRAEGEPLDAVSAVMVLDASGDRRGVLDVTEAWLGWNPVPGGPWKMRVKAGAFFPPTSIEVDYDSIGWTPSRTVSSSAINSWIGEELRTKGIEAALSHLGRLDGSPHDYGATVGLFKGNDPAGTLLAWRGWAIGDRITGLRESIRLADLPVYRADGAIARQDRTIHVFREVDNRLGYYAGAHYSYAGMVEVAALHYDNRGEPLAVINGQYSWDTRFDHLSLHLRARKQWELLFQAMHGATTMGANAVSLDYTAWYVLASRPLGPGTLALRYDRFTTREHDALPSDPNGESGRAYTLAYNYHLGPSLALVTELQLVRSSRSARVLIGQAVSQTERGLTAALRWQF